MGTQRVLSHELLRDLTRNSDLNAAANVDLRQFLLLRFWIFRKLALLSREICLFSIRLRADRNILPRRHGQGPGDETSDTRKQYIALGGSGSGDAEDQTRRGDDPVICPEHGGPEPSNTLDKVGLL